MPVDRTRAIARGTRDNLIQGIRARPLSVAAVDAAFEQAGRFADELVDLYARTIAVGEVGSVGNGRASDAPISSNRLPTALMYGRVQSGKTAAMILTTALCIDNGFKVVVVLTADNVALVRQTATRFRALDGPLVFSTIKTGDNYDWVGREEEIRQSLSNDGIVLICAKDAYHLPPVYRFLQQIDGPSYPALIFDDEADAATPDTTLAARTAGRPNAPLYPSTIYSRVLENVRPGQEGESLGELFPHRLYVQVTATPFILFLQRSDSYLRPDHTFLLDAGEGYCGGATFFDRLDPDHDDMPQGPVVLVPTNEAQTITRRAVPAGLRASIEYFLIAAAAAAARNHEWPREGYKHLSHSSPNTVQHDVVVDHIERHLWEIRNELRLDHNASINRFAPAHAELRRTVPDVAGVEMLVRAMEGMIRQYEIITVNSQNDVPPFGPRVNYLVGGNILGRGLTIDDLLVTYYVREAQVPQMDTVWQHARMFGYRRDLMDFTRVYVPRRIAFRFKEIHESEEYLRELLAREQAGERVMIKVVRGMRPTRPNATARDDLSVIRAGEAQLHPQRLHDSPEFAQLLLTELRAAGVPIGEDDRNVRLARMPLDQGISIIERIPISEADLGTWRPEFMIAILESYRDQLNGGLPISVRGLAANADRMRTRGRLSGPEIDIIRAQAAGVPALALLYVGDVVRPIGIHPTLVMPANSPPFLFNPD